MALRVTIEGDEELIRKLKAMGDRAATAIRPSVEDGAEVVRTDANRRAPGPNIYYKLELTTNERATYAISFDDEHWHYQFIELGVDPHPIEGNPLLVFVGRNGLVRAHHVDHPGFASRPFLRPALVGNKPGIQDAVGDRLRIEVIGKL